MTHNSIRTEICSLLWEPFSIGRSPLYTLCKEICGDKESKKSNKQHSHCNEENFVYDNEKVKELYESCLRHWTILSDLLCPHKGAVKNKENFTISVSDRVFDTFVFYAESSMVKECVVAFLCKDRNGNFSMRGIHSTDERWLITAKKIFEKTKEGSFPGIHNLLIMDNRTSHQKNRDIVLLSYYCKLFHTRGKAAYEAYNYSKILNKNIIYMAKYVFPLHITKGSKYWPDAIQYLRVKLEQSERKPVGIDIRTGCGALALDLSYKLCDHVYALEGDPKAMSNALMNYNRFNMDHRDHKHNISFYCGTQIGDGCLPSDLFLQYDTFIITYNYIFYESIFCTMSYDFLKEKTEKFDETHTLNFLKTNMSQDVFKMNIESIFVEISKNDTTGTTKNVIVIIPCSVTLLEWAPSDILDLILTQTNNTYHKDDEGRKWFQKNTPIKYGHADGRLLIFHFFLSSGSTELDIHDESPTTSSC